MSVSARQRAVEGPDVPAAAAPRTSIDLTSLVRPLHPSLFYFPVLTPAAAASAHFPPSLCDAPSVDVRRAFCFVAYVLENKCAA